MVKHFRFGSIVMLGLFLLLRFVSPHYAQSSDEYTLSWVTINAGGNSSSDDWNLIGIIGQPDVAVLAGGDYTLEGGFLHSHYLIYLPLILRERQ